MDYDKVGRCYASFMCGSCGLYYTARKQDVEAVEAKTSG
jgi:hypothetical protein